MIYTDGKPTVASEGVSAPRYVLTVNNRRATGQTFTVDEAAKAVLRAREEGDKVEVFVAHDDLGRRYRLATAEQQQPIIDAAVSLKETA